MKKIFVMLAIAALSTTTVSAQTSIELAKQQKELNDFNRKILDAKPSREAKKQAKALQKEGWKVPAGEHSIEQQVMRSLLYGEELMKNDNGDVVSRYICKTSTAKQGSYGLAESQARALVQQEVGAMLETRIASMLEIKQDGSQSSADAGITVDKFHNRAKAIMDAVLTNAHPLMVLYRVNGNQYEVQVRLAFDKKEVAARLKHVMERELEAEGDKLNGFIDQTMNEDF